MAWIIGAGVFVIGFFTSIIGAILLAYNVKGTGKAEIPGVGDFSGPVWFIMMIVGIVFMVTGWTMPF